MVIYGSHLLAVGIFISLLKYIHLYSYILIPVPPAVFKVGQYFRHRLFVWMPKKMWKLDLKCPDCSSSLTTKGVYRTLRKVVDVDGYYFMATEYLGK